MKQEKYYKINYLDSELLTKWSNIEYRQIGFYDNCVYLATTAEINFMKECPNLPKPIKEQMDAEKEREKKELETLKESYLKELETNLWQSTIEVFKSNIETNGDTQHFINSLFGKIYSLHERKNLATNEIQKAKNIETLQKINIKFEE